MNEYSQLKELLHKIYPTVDTDWIISHSEALTKIEQGQTFRDYEKAANYMFDLLTKEGLQPEMLTFPADGKTSYLDLCTPLAWDATNGRLTVVKSSIAFPDPVIADFEKIPASLYKHSTSTPEGGITVPVVAESHVYAGQDCRGAMVLLEAESQPCSTTIAPLLDMGAIGVISDYLPGAFDFPDAVFWVNAGTDAPCHWHVTVDDRDFIGFSITPRIGRKLRTAVYAGGVDVLVECDGHRYEGHIHAVTALIPGRSQRELWLMGHLYEPFIDDNSACAIMTLAAVLQIQKMIQDGILPPLEFSIRLVYAMESYGYAAVAHHFGGDLRSRVIGALNLDTSPMLEGCTDDVLIRQPGYASPFFGKAVFALATRTCRQYLTEQGLPYTPISKTLVNCGDDALLSDSTVGLPTIYYDREYEKNLTWHTYCQESFKLDPDKVREIEAMSVLWTSIVATMSEKTLPGFVTAAAALAQEKLLDVAGEMACSNTNPAERMRFFLEGEQNELRDFKKVADIPQIDEAAQRLFVPELPENPFESPWLNYAKGIIPTRITVGFPFDLHKLPKNKRHGLPGGGVYGAMSSILAGMDGKRDLAQLILGASWECGDPITEKSIKSYVNAVMYLADAGYLSCRNENTLEKHHIMDILKKMGITQGDTLLVHSSLSGCGYITGGADTVIDAFIDTVGNTGTVLMPLLNHPYVGFGCSVNTSHTLRPYHPDVTGNIWTGAIPRTLLAREGTLRSAHCTHSWCGVGEKAALCLSEHKLLDPPTSRNSPPAKAMDQDGKVVLFGCTPSSNTFLHFLETEANSPFLVNAFVRILDDDGKLHTEIIPSHLPGHRDFYNRAGLEAKFYQKAMEKGLQIRHETFGLGHVYVMELKELYRIGMELFKEDPNITLCDDPNCHFCSKYH